MQCIRNRSRYWLPPKYNTLSCVDKLLIELGKTPSNWFASIPSSSIFVQFLKVIKKSKSLPKLLLVRRRSSRSSRYPKLVGTDPTKLLLPRSSFWSWDALHKELGIEPKNLLLPSSINLRLGRVWPMFAGRVPVSWFCVNEKTLIDDILQSEEGFIPFNLLSPTLKNDKVFKWPMPFGIFPSKLL